MRRGIVSLCLSACVASFAADVPPEVVLTEPEQQRVDAFLDEFYREDLTEEQMKAQMMRRQEKYYARDAEVRVQDLQPGKKVVVRKVRIKKGERVSAADRTLRNHLLVLSEERKRALSEDEKTHPLLQQAQAKATKRYYKQYCEQVLKRKFPKIDCEELQKPSPKATIEWNDRVEQLVEGWIEEGDIARSLDDLPTAGKSRLPLWSDDYWSIAGGITSTRYAEGHETNHGENWKSNVASYTQPGRNEADKEAADVRLEWNPLRNLYDAAKISTKIVNWSPAEKLDLSAGDTDFTLTRHQKSQGSAYADDKGNVEPWMGICHGWAAVSIMMPPAMVPFTVLGAAGVRVKWFPHDVAAMQSLAWANGGTYEYDSARGTWREFQTNFIGGRCNNKKPDTYRNGRLKDQNCFDNNPGTFLLALGNMVGRKGFSFVMDKTFDYEVWNQPVDSYSVQYFNPSRPRQRCGKDDWKRCSVAYDRRFQRTDRFSKNPREKTRGVRTAFGTYDDSKVDSIVGVIFNVAYVAESAPTQDGQPAPALTVRVTYTGDLELEERPGGKLVVAGGEWHSDAHPDFLWVPRKNSVATMRAVDLARRYEGVEFTGEEPDALTTELAQAGSRSGYPPCRILKGLVKRATEGQRPHPVSPLVCAGEAVR